MVLPVVNVTNRSDVHIVSLSRSELYLAIFALLSFSRARGKYSFRCAVRTVVLDAGPAIPGIMRISREILGGRSSALVCVMIKRHRVLLPALIHGAQSYPTYLNMLAMPNRCAIDTPTAIAHFPDPESATTEFSRRFQLHRRNFQASHSNSSYRALKAAEDHITSNSRGIGATAISKARTLDGSNIHCKRRRLAFALCPRSEKPKRPELSRC